MDRLLNVLLAVTLVEMMFAIGLGVRLAELAGVARDWSLVGRSLLANYVCVPAAAVALLSVFGANELVSAGFVILAVCPGAPYGPPFTSLARGDVTVSVGLMVILAGSSALAAPILLRSLLPLVSASRPLAVDTSRMVATLLATQLLPLAAGVVLHHVRPAAAHRLDPPARLLSKLLNLAAVILILTTQYQLLSEVRPRALIGMSALLAVSLAAGWLLGGPGGPRRKAASLTTSLRNVGLGLVIANGAFPGTPATTAALAYGLVEVLGSLLVALAWGRGRRTLPTAGHELSMSRIG